MDIWSNRQMRSYTGITVHYILDWKLESAMLSCNRFKGRHTGENIFQEYENTITSFEISSKLHHVITDHASNMLKAFSLPGFKSFNQDDINSDDEDTEDSNENEDEDDEDGSSYLLNVLPVQHHGCFAHALQLVIKDGFKDARQIERIISKCSKIVSHVRKSTIATEVLEGEKKLEIANATCWNSQLKMIRSILAADPAKMDSIKDAPKLTQYERNIIKDLVEILTPFEEATDFSQIENHPSAGYVIPCIRGLLHQLETMTSKYNCAFVLALKNSLTKRMHIYETKQLYHTATILDPRFKLLWCKDSDEKKEMKTMIINLASSFSSAKESITQIKPENDDNQPPKKKKRVFLFMEQQHQLPKETSHELEISKYLEEPIVDHKTDPLEYWKSKSEQFPILSAIAEATLAVPASSAPVERLFSIAGKVFRPDRCRLSDATFESLMFIRCNKHLKQNN